FISIIVSSILFFFFSLYGKSLRIDLSMATIIAFLLHLVFLATILCLLIPMPNLNFAVILDSICRDPIITHPVRILILPLFLLIIRKTWVIPHIFPPNAIYKVPR